MLRGDRADQLRKNHCVPRRLTVFAMALLAIGYGSSFVTGDHAFASELLQPPQVIFAEAVDVNPLPVMVTSGSLPYSIGYEWNSSLQMIEGMNEIAENQSFAGDDYSAENPQLNHDAEGACVNNEAGVGGLPTFRGINGIKNLPGGVGTVLMAHPHAGANWYPTQSTDQPGTTLQTQRNYFQAGVPIYSSERDTFVFTSYFDSTQVQTNAILPTTNQPFPNQLYKIAFGVNHFHSFENGNLGGIIFDLGTASDKPFESGRDMLASGTAFLLIPRDENGSWFVGVKASTNSQVLYGIPIPGGGYFYHPSENLQAIVGFPFSVISYKPAPDWQLEYVWAFMTTMHARAAYHPVPNWEIYAGFDWTNENWNRAERLEDRSRFFYFEKKLATGVLWWFRPHVGLDVSGGWAFDRYYTEIDGSFAVQGINTVNVGSGPFVSAQFDVRF